MSYYGQTHYTVGEAGTLTIKEAMPEHAGKYTCIRAIDKKVLEFMDLIVLCKYTAALLLQQLVPIVVCNSSPQQFIRSCVVSFSFYF